MSNSNEIRQATERAPQGDGLRKTARAGYQAATVQAPNKKKTPDWEGFLSTASNLYGKVKKEKDERSVRRGNQIIAELTPDERADAIERGELLYQDDANAMKHLNRMVGKERAQEEDLSLQRLIRNGDYTTREEVDAHMAEQYTAAKAKGAALMGVDENDPDYTAGFNENLNPRRVAIYESLDQHESGRLESQALLSTSKHVSQIINDPVIISDPDNAVSLAAHMQQQRDNGTIPRNTVFREVLVDSVKQIASTAGSTEFLARYGNQEVQIDGIQLPLRDLIGADQFDNYILQSETSTRSKDLASNQERQHQLNDIDILVRNGHYEQADARLSNLEAADRKRYPSDQLTEGKQELINARLQLNQAHGVQTQVQRNALVKEETVAKGYNTVMKAMVAREGGDYGVSTDANVLGLQHPDEVNTMVAAEQLRLINENDSLSDKQKVAERLRVAALTHMGSPLREAIQENSELMRQEVQAAVVSDDTDIDWKEDMQGFQGLHAQWKENKHAFAMIDPEGAAVFEMVGNLDLASVKGIQTYVRAQRSITNMSPELQHAERAQFEEAFQSSDYKHLAQMSGKDHDTLYLHYQAQLHMKVNPTTAAEVAFKQWSENNVPVVGQNAMESNGRLSKALLTLDPTNPDSHKQGLEAVQDTLNTIIDNNPNLDGSLWTVQEGANDTVMFLHQGSDPYFMPMSTLREAHITELQQQATESQLEARKVFNERKEQDAVNAKRNAEKDSYEPELQPKLFEGKAKFTTSTYKDGKNPADVKRDVGKLNKTIGAKKSRKSKAKRGKGGRVKSQRN